MALSWSRGLLRTWVVVALAWVALVTGIVVVSYPTAASFSYALKGEGGVTITLERVLAAVDKANAAGDAEAAFDLLARAAKHNRDLRQDQSESIRQGAVAAIAPPVVLLILGGAIAWALRGFRAAS